VNLANKLTISRIALIPLFLLVLLIPLDIPGRDFIAAAIFVIAALTDTLDGHVARSRNMITTFGKFADPIADKLLVVAALLVMVEWGRVSALLAFVIVAREFIVSGLRLVAVSEGVVIAASKLGKLKTATQIVAIVAVLLNNYPFSTFGFPMADILMILAAILTLWSGIDYMIKCKHFLKIQ
jgi:CDP-diacylglycerol--glycerol-3-phosphate 3-phosphatidyltransferase